MKNFCSVVLVGCPQSAYSVYIKEVITQLVLCTKLDIFGSQWRSERTQTQREWTKPEPGFIQELNTKAVFSHACRCDLSQSLIKSRWISKWIRICSNHMHSSSQIIIRDSVAILIELLFGLARHYICATFVTFCNYLLVVFDKIPITGVLWKFGTQTLRHGCCLQCHFCGRSLQGKKLTKCCFVWIVVMVGYFFIQPAFVALCSMAKMLCKCQQ